MRETPTPLDQPQPLGQPFPQQAGRVRAPWETLPLQELEISASSSPQLGRAHNDPSP